ncbi:hypothetical protein AXG93_2654s1020 [Marchantia polymorpha subsp. ruderalis]|uniref:Protein kinase domain-containing protein n=1 Tax=Marchantia polymorpha subsp. ruderalis TaxID=1480154 RepID=A0A176W3C2_MARPO|nr:hypothetical protein AXG93_2654s1020 [Marchantia polymorpha subsp. ruderalis]
MSRFRRGHGFLLWIRCRESCGRPTNKAVQASVNDNARQVQSLRFFSPYRSKHCYTLPAVYNSSYILRAMFLYSNFQAASDQHSFDVSIDSTLADTVNITSAEVDTPQVFEYIDFASSPWISDCESMKICASVLVTSILCLPRGIELIVSRCSTGTLKIRMIDCVTPPAKTSRVILVPDDNFDKQPMVVMQTARLDSTVCWFTPIPQYDLQRTAYYYTNLFSAEIQTVNATDTRLLNVQYNNFPWGPWLVDVSSSTFNEKHILVNTEVEIYTGGVNFTLSAPPNATLDPLLNAAQIYASRAVVVLRTNDVDGSSHLLPVASLKVRKAASTVAALVSVKAALGLNSWAGDPCLPVPYSWVTCYNSSSPRVITITDGNVNLCSATENCPDLAAPGPGGDSKSSGVSGAVIGVAVGGVVVVSLILVLLLFLYCRRSRRPPSVHAAMSETASSDVKGKIAPVLIEHSESLAGHVNQARGFFLAEVQRATNGYEKKIGEGGFGLVYHGKLPDGSEVAVKVNSEKSGQGTTEFINEVSLLSRVHHRNLVSLVGYCEESGQQSLVYEYMSKGTLREHLYGKGTSENQFGFSFRLNESLCDLTYTDEGWIRCVRVRADMKGTLTWTERLNIAIDAAKGTRLPPNEAQIRVSTQRSRRDFSLGYR